MIFRFIVIVCVFLIFSSTSTAQCSSPVNSFPYQESFETSNGGWFAGGSGSDWIWGSPTKPVINTSGDGSKCWIVGGLTGSSYTNSEASWLQSPCFDLSSVQYPFIDLMIYWETEQQFDGASFQYSIDNGSSWTTIGSINDAQNCLNENWYNQSPVTYLSPLSSNREGWSGNIQPTSGSCRGGNGSNGWVRAKHVMPYLAGKPTVIFRFIFGAGSICNAYDGFAIDNIIIGEAPPNHADFTYTCITNNTVSFTNSSLLCPSGFLWDFGDPSSASDNKSALQNPQHSFSGPGTYTVTFAVNGPGNAPSTASKDITILSIAPSLITPADCETGNGGSAMVSVAGGSGNYSYHWNTIPPQTTAIASNLSSHSYSVTVSEQDACDADTSITIPLNPSCFGIYFPSAFTPNSDGKNDLFGPLGSLSLVSNYSLSVFNRWGEKVFYSKNPFQKWDGLVGNKKPDSGTFVWYAEFSLQGQPKEFRKGFLTLIR